MGMDDFSLPTLHLLHTLHALLAEGRTLRMDDFSLSTRRELAAAEAERASICSTANRRPMSRSSVRAAGEGAAGCRGRAVGGWAKGG